MSDHGGRTAVLVAMAGACCASAVLAAPDDAVREELRLQAGSAKVVEVGISGDGTVVAARLRESALEGPVAVWRLSGQGPQRLRGPFEASARGIALSSDGAVLASAGTDRVTLWSLAGGRQVDTVESRRPRLFEFSPNGRWLAVSGMGQPFLWDLKARRKAAVLASEKHFPEAMTLSADGRVVATADVHGTVRLWDLRGQQREMFKMADDLDDLLAISPDGKLVAARARMAQEGILLWEIGTGRVRTLDTGNPKSGVCSLAFAPSGNLVAGHISGIITITDPGGMRTVARLEGHAQPVVALALSADGRKLASGSWDGTVRIWSPAGTAGPRGGVAKWTPPADEPPVAVALPPRRVGGSLREPRIRYKAQPSYPDGAKEARVAGVVVLELTIAPEGHVVDAKVLRGVHPEIDQAAVDAVKEWVYEPTMVNGSAVPLLMTVTVRFALE
jgi:TonB family protein